MDDNVGKSPSEEDHITEKPFAELPEVPLSEPTTVPTPAADPSDLNSLNIESSESEEEQSPKPRDLIPPKNKKSSKKVVIILLVIILIIALGGGAYVLLSKKPTKKQDAGTAQTGQSSTSSSTAVEETPTPKAYTNSALKIDLTYLSDWTVKESTGKVLLTSPSFSYKKKDGSTTKGSFSLMIQQGVSTTDSSIINDSTAVKISELIKYTAPLPGQRTDTYLSFLGKTKDAFEFFLVSSGKQYNVGDKVSGTLPLGQDSYVIAGGYGGKTDNNFSFDEIAVDGIEQNKAYTQAVDIVKSLKIH